MLRSYLIVSSLLLALALFTGWESLNLSYYSPLGPGPGFFPFWLAAGLGVSAVGMAVERWRAPSLPP